MNTSSQNTWDAPLTSLAKSKKPSQSLLKLSNGGIKTLKDLIWIFPLRIQAAPKVSHFEQIEENKLFLGRAKLINIQFTPAFGRKGKSGIQLFNATCVIKDVFSEKLLNLKWFNTYPSLKKQLENLDEFTFLGQVTLFKQTLQIVNPQINPKDITDKDGILIEYPTVNSVPGKQIEKIIKLVPKPLWDIPISDISLSHLQKNISLNLSLIHI